MTLLSVAALLLLWELVSRLAGSDNLLPSVLKTFGAAFAIMGNAAFLKTVGVTLLRALSGFVLALLGGVFLGIAGGLHPTVHSFLRPWVVMLRSTPVVAFVLLAIIWFSSDAVPVFIGILTMFPIVYLNTVEGVAGVDRKILEMARFYGVGGMRLVRELYLPSLRPFISSGVRTAVGMGWRAIVVGEVLSQPQWGIGSVMHSAQVFLQVDVLIAWVLVTVLIGALFEKICALFLTK